MTRQLAGARSSVPRGRGGAPDLRTVLPGGHAGATSVGLVARDRELSELERALGHCRLGGSALVVLRGESGTGKSALLAATVSRGRDFSVFRLRAAASAGARAPEWPAPLAELLEADEVDDEARLARSAAAAIDALAAEPGLPLLLEVDDAHLLPRPVLQAIASAADKGLVSRSCLVVLALSDPPHLKEVPLEVAPRAVCRLGGLTEEQASKLLARVLGRPLRPALVRALVRAVGGNPQAVLSVGAALDDEVLKGWKPLPDPVALEASQQRHFGACLEELPAETRRALAVSASGRMPLTVLEAALSELDLALSCFDGAVERKIVTLQRNRISFAHPLVRAAAYRSVPEDVRVSAHAALSHAFAGAGLVELSAEHAQRSGAAPTTLIGLLGQAERVALDRADLSLAASYQEAMADLGGSDEEVLQHLTRAAAWWMAAGDLDRAAHFLDRATVVPVPEELRGPLVYWRARAQMAGQVDARTASDLEAAAGHVQLDASGSAALMLGEAAVCQLVVGEAGAAERLAAQAIEAAGVVGGFPEAFAAAVVASVRVLGRLGTDGADGLRPATSFLQSQPDALPLSPLFATVVGLALLEQSGPEAASTWAAWLERNAATTGNVSLSPVAGLLSAHVALRQGALEEAAELATAAADGAVAHGQRALAVRALGVLLEAQSGQGRYQSAFVTASRLFADAGDGEHRIRAVAYRALAELELQRCRVPSALSWLKAAESEVTSREPGQARADARLASWAAVLAEVYVHDQRLDAVGRLVDLVDRAARHGAVEPAWSPAVRGIVASDLPGAEECFNAALRLSRDEPLLRARLESCYAARLAAEGLADRAARRLQAAVTTARDVGASGWASLFELALDRLDAAAPSRPDLAVLAGGMEDVAPEPLQAVHPAGAGRQEDAARLDPSARWELTMLGSFNVRHEDALISMPTSLAATALKLVALRRRILVEELVEELWPESAPGVGMRRLRNVLWRVRVACGEILVREDKLILLSPEAVTDVEVFRRIAVQALDPSTPEEKAAELARSALGLYEGELLPMDRYADWAAATRESLSRLQVQLIELRVQQAVEEDRVHEALGLLEQLIESDPYEESHYLRVAELHERTGNRRRALAALGRAERTLAELGIPPSPDLQRLSQRLS